MSAFPSVSYRLPTVHTKGGGGGVSGGPGS